MSTAFAPPPTPEISGQVPVARFQSRLLKQFMADAPFQPATNLWRCIELPVLAAALPSEGRGLDVGCGDGVLTRILRDLVGPSWRLVGVDPDPLETALAESSGVYERVHTCGADRIDEPDGSFDFAFSNSVLEHIPGLAACLAEVARCLRPGGRFLATVPGPAFHDCVRGPGFLARQPRNEYLAELDRRLAHHNYWSPERWREELGRVGLALEAADPYLAREQVARWEVCSNWTGGLLYRLRGGRKPPITIQRDMGLRRGLPRPLRFLAGPLARAVGRGVLGPGKDGAKACLLVHARKPG